ncbi:hypothetical protein CEXT_734201 [Caerostris extrusa]|uniref:Uncharacterized protein n=1 Tax=Caerostris extrusa TaxID=172846 RepID=A0AAV4MIL5_CAEEX|nr:hypothetical protein CEXT_734201 [Caerostris extrusa]
MKKIFSLSLSFSVTKEHPSFCASSHPRSAHEASRDRRELTGSPGRKDCDRRIFGFRSKRSSATFTPPDRTSPNRLARSAIWRTNSSRKIREKDEPGKVTFAVSYLRHSEIRVLQAIGERAGLTIYALKQLKLHHKSKAVVKALS